ncbi:MAG: hypothetical protein WBL25_03955 [Anaerolineales bacterium]
MKNQDITHPRLCNQRLSQATFEKPADAVGWLVAVQAQDYFGAKWFGVTVADSRVGLEALKDRFEHERLDGKKYWFPEPTPSGKVASPIAYCYPFSTNMLPATKIAAPWPEKSSPVRSTRWELRSSMSSSSTVSSSALESGCSRKMW